MSNGAVVAIISGRLVTGRKCDDPLHPESGGDPMNRRTLVAAIALLFTAVLLGGWPVGLPAQSKVVKIGLSLPLTGADADGADAMMKGAQMAVAEINAKGGAAGHKLETVVYDSATPAAGQYDPALLDQSRHHRSQVPVAVPAQGQGRLFPHGDDRRLPGPEHGELPLSQPENEERLHPGRRRGLRGGHRRQLPEARGGARGEDPRARPT